MLSVVLIDDEELAIGELEYLIGRIPGVKVTGKYTDSRKALADLAAGLNPDVIFLDIDMPGLDGVTLAECINKMKINPFIVFATVSPEHVLKAFELEAIDYLRKPFSESRLNVTIDRIRKRKNAHLREKDPRQTVKGPDLQNRIAVRHGERIFLLKLDEVLYCTIVNKRTLVRTEKVTYQSGLSLNQLADRLQGEGFFRCHKSYLVNLNHVKSIIPHFKYTGVIKLKDVETELPVSRTKMRILKELLSL